MGPIAASALHRLFAELACIVGCICAAALAYADKSAWVWSWFLIFAAFNIVTGTVKVSETTTTKTSARPATET